MATVDVLMAVDVEGALASKDLSDNIYMVDTNKYMGSVSEGSDELSTTLNIGDTIVWSVAPIDPATNVVITSFGGDAVVGTPPGKVPATPPKVIVPVEQTNGSFSAVFQPAGGTASGTQYQYTATLTMEGDPMSFDPYLIIAG